MWQDVLLLWEDCWFFRVNLVIATVLLLVVLLK